jgi:hypothetical protein
MGRRRYRKSPNCREVERQIFLSAHILLQLKRYVMLMAVMVPMPREKWTDERLDDLNKKVDEGFARVDADIREVRGEINGLRKEMNERFDSMKGLIDARFDALNRNQVAGFFAIVAAIIGSNAL